MTELKGKVIRGEQYGRKLGFPTANLDRRDYGRRHLKIKLGVYAGWAEIVASGKHQVSRKYRAGIVMGPTDKSGLPKIEAHLIGFKGNLYDRRIKLNLIKYLRPFKKFRDAKELKERFYRILVL